MLFRPTNSVTTNIYQQQKQQQEPKINILKQLFCSGLSTYREDGIQTFAQFKQFVNKFDFQANQKQIPMKATLKPKITIHESHEVDVNRDRTYQRGSSMDSGLKHDYQLNNGSLGVNFLAAIEQRVESRSNLRRLQIQQANNLNSGLKLTSELHNQKKQENNQSAQLGLDNQENIEVKSKSSARSKRSFNGYQQINDYEVKQKLGTGGFSTVSLCIDVRTNKKYAMKIVKKKQMQKKLFRKGSFQLAEMFIDNQIALLKKMSHPNIIKLYEVIQDEVKEQIYMILEYCDGGFINQFKEPEESKEQAPKFRKLLESECKRYYKQIAVALDYVHNIAKIAHRDIKPENILLSGKDEIKISDFGLGTLDLTSTSRSGTIGYLPPEAKDKNLIPSTMTQNVKFVAQMADIWALGITLIVLLIGKTVDIEPEKLQSFIFTLKDVSDSCKDFLRKCLEINPEKRITSAQIIEHPWIQAQKSVYDEIFITQQQQKHAISPLTRDILTVLKNVHLSQLK